MKMEIKIGKRIKSRIKSKIRRGRVAFASMDS